MEDQYKSMSIDNNSDATDTEQVTGSVEREIKIEDLIKAWSEEEESDPEFCMLRQRDIANQTGIPPQTLGRYANQFRDFLEKKNWICKNRAGTARYSHHVSKFFSVIYTLINQCGFTVDQIKEILANPTSPRRNIIDPMPKEFQELLRGKDEVIRKLYLQNKQTTHLLCEQTEKMQQMLNLLEDRSNSLEALREELNTAISLVKELTEQNTEEKPSIWKRIFGK